MAGNPRDKPNPVRDLFDAAALHYAIRLSCRRCRHQRIFDPHALWYLFERRGWLRDVRRRCRCAECGAREPALDLVHEAPTGEPLKMPSNLNAGEGDVYPGGQGMVGRGRPVSVT